METSVLREELVEADVLCIGGGIAGLMAAIRASELGAKVVIAEKGNAIYGGRGRIGCDHFWCYIPEVHGPDMEAFLKGCLKGPKLQAALTGANMEVLRNFCAESFKIVKLWDNWGIPMKYEGRWEFAGHSFPGDILTHLKYEGRGQKPILVKKAFEKGAEIINRVMVFDLLGGNGGIFGAIGVGTREDKLIVFKAKSIILGTGYVERLYPPTVFGWLASISPGFMNTGDGRAAVYRAGGELAGMEVFRRHSGPRYFVRGGIATWVGVLRDPQGKPIGPYLTKPDSTYNDMTLEVNSLILEDYLKSGRGPVYMDCRGISDEDYEYFMHWFEHEGYGSFVNYMTEEGIDLRRNPVEFGTTEIASVGKIRINEKAETSIKGVYATGDESIGTVGPAATYGWIAGENAAKYAKEKSPADIEKSRTEIEGRKSHIHVIRTRKVGPDWKEANIALQQIMQDYAGMVRSKTLLKAGLSYLRRLREKVNATIVARNQWELIRCLEIQNLLDLEELVFISANERKETRGLHRRPDYPLTDPMLGDKFLLIEKVEGKPVTKWRKME